MGLAQGMAGVVRRLLMSNAPQIPLLTPRIRKARSVARATARVRPEKKHAYGSYLLSALD